ncbi:MAG: hypothetical protein ACR2F1_03235 [Nitrososphaeraceae archaeon]
MTRKIQTQIEWRRSKVLEMISKGYNQIEISKMLQVDVSTICRDVSYLKIQAKDNIKTYVDEKLPEEYEKCLAGLNSILKEAWNISSNSPDKREKIQALSLAKECYSMKLDLLTNATVVNDVMRFISSSTNSNNNNNNIVSIQTNTKKGSSSIDKKIVSLNNDSESNDKDKTIYDKTENKNIIENEENDIQRFTEDNNSKRRESTYNSVF